MYRISFFSLFLLLFSVLNCEGAIQFEKNQSSVNLGSETYHFIEGSKPLSIKDVSSSQFTANFESSEGEHPNFGITEGAYWFKVSIDYISNETRPSLKYLEISHPYLDHVEFYSKQQNGEFSKTIVGDRYPFKQRPIDYHTFVFKVELDPSQTNDLYFRVETTTSLQMPITLWQPETFVQQSSNKRLLLGVFYGSLLVMFFYNLFVYLSVRDKSYLYYIIYIFLMCLAQMSSDGTGFQIIWPNSPLFANVSTPIFINSTILLAIIFSREYLNIKQFAPKWDTVSLFFSAITVINTIPAFLGYRGFAVTFTTAWLLIMSVFLLSLGAWGVYKKQRRAYFFFAAWLALCIGSSIRAVFIFNLVPTNFFSLYGIQIGVTLELVLLSLALADRMNQDRAEKMKAVNSALMASEQALKAKDDRREVERKLIQQSLYDQLTGHPNRVLCKEQLKLAIDNNNADKDVINVFCIHLNNFHDINNTLGHDIGDQLLIKFLSQLEQRVSDWTQVLKITHNDNPTKHIAIVEGVYLSLLFHSSIDDNDVRDHSEKLIKILDIPIVFNGMSITISGQIGISMWPNHGIKTETLMRKAMIAVRAAKWSGRRIQVYDESIDLYSPNRLSLMSDLKRAIAEDQLELYFQPKVSMQSRHTISIEALVRWNHPEQGLLSPDKFVDFAESAGLIQSLTQWVLNDAISFCACLNQQKFNISVAVNISARNLLEDDFVKRLCHLLDAHALAPSNLTLEVVESSMIEDMELTIGTLRQLEENGIKLSIDDFGTGYSSLEYLKRLPVHELKIDRSFVSDMQHNKDDKLIVSTTLAIAHQREMNVVAEGIEDKATFELLEQMGCDIGQGYYISKPVKRAELMAVIQHDSPWNATRKEILSQ